jgi:hypothetical protein
LPSILLAEQGTYLPLGDLGLDCWPGLALSSITEQVHDDGTPGDGLVDVEKVLARDPAVLLGVLPRLTVFPHADDDVETIVTHVQGLGMALRSVPNDGHCVIFEVFLRVKCYSLHRPGKLGGSRIYLELGRRPVGSLYYIIVSYATPTSGPETVP